MATWTSEAWFVFIAIFRPSSSWEVVFRQGSLLSLFPFNFVIEIVMEFVLSSFEDSDTDMWLDRRLCDSEYANDIVLISEDRLTDSLDMFWIRFAPVKCKMIFQEWISPKQSPIFAGKELSETDIFEYLDSLSPQVVTSQMSFLRIYRRHDCDSAVCGICDICLLFACR